MKTAKEVTRELGIKYEDLKGVLKALKIKKLFGVYRLSEANIRKIKRELR